jgi:hypothetical protein
MFGQAFVTVLMVTATGVLAAGCGNAGDASTHPSYIQANYDDRGRLQQLSYDRNKDGHIDTVAFMDGTRFVRIEIDGNEDGSVDRWEYYGADQKLQKLGLSRADDGRPDTWSFQDPKGQVSRIELSMRGDGKVDRTESYENGALVRAEEDSDGDGRLDRWESYAGGLLRTVAFDTAGTGKPDRRLLYSADGVVERLEVDSRGDGTFSPGTNRVTPDTLSTNLPPGAR